MRPRRARHGAWLLTSAVLVASAASTAVATSAPEWAAAARRSEATGAARGDELRVAVVIDFGTRSGVTPEVVTMCVHVRPGTNGTDVLASVLSQMRASAASYNDSGLLCSIDGYPGHGCGTPVGSGYAYWSYWHGGTRWTYANLGPAEWTLPDHDVEGWRFERDGTAGPSDTPPHAPSQLAAICASPTAYPVSSATGAPGATSTETYLLIGLAGLIVIVLGAASIARWRRPADE